MHGKHKHQRGMRHGRGDWGERSGRRGWGRHHRHGGGRMFEQGSLRHVVLALLAEQPRHGYEIIKEIEDRAGGAYAPSPGVIYPLLTMLEELGLARLDASEGGKKLYAITPEGEAELAENKSAVEHLFARMAAVRESAGSGRPPQVVRAIENLRLALSLRLERGSLTEEQSQAIAAAIDAAATAIERS